MTAYHTLWMNLKLTIRSLARDRIYAAIAVFGLGCALACAILVCGRVIDALGHAEHYENADRIYRVLRRTDLDTRISVNDWIAGGITVAAREQFPEIELAGRSSSSRLTRTWVKSGDATFKHFFGHADPELFDLLEMTFWRGGITSSRNTVVVTRRVAA